MNPVRNLYNILYTKPFIEKKDKISLYSSNKRISNGVRRYIIIPCVLSIIGHGLFFSIFKGDIISRGSPRDAGLYLITREQFNYLNTIAIRERDFAVFPLSKSLSSKNSMWKEALDIIDISRIKGLDVPLDEEGLLEETKSCNFLEIPISLVWHQDANRDITPMYGDLFYLGLLQEKISQGGEFILDLKNKIKMGYYLQGPVSSRQVTIESVPIIDKAEIKASFRFWVTKDGRVNQVIIEEGSSFPLVDSDMVSFIKTWRFSPVFDPASSNYEWGIVRIRLFR